MKTIKPERRFVKEQKRLLKLLYRKGVLSKDWVENITWTEEYRGTSCKPILSMWYECGGWEAEYDTCDLIDKAIEKLHYDNVPDFQNVDENGFPVSSFDYGISRRQLIQYLKSLPTIRHDSKINKFMKIQIT